MVMEPKYLAKEVILHPNYHQVIGSLGKGINNNHMLCFPPLFVWSR